MLIKVQTSEFQNSEFEIQTNSALRCKVALCAQNPARKPHLLKKTSHITRQSTKHPEGTTSILNILNFNFPLAFCAVPNKIVVKMIVKRCFLKACSYYTWLAAPNASA